LAGSHLGSDKVPLLKTGVTFDTLNTSGTMPVEIDLFEMYPTGLERVLEANPTNLFGTSNDDFLEIHRFRNFLETLPVIFKPFLPVSKFLEPFLVKWKGAQFHCFVSAYESIS